MIKCPFVTFLYYSCTHAITPKDLGQSIHSLPQQSIINVSQLSSEMFNQIPVQVVIQESAFNQLNYWEVSHCIWSDRCADISIPEINSGSRFSHQSTCPVCVSWSCKSYILIGCDNYCHQEEDYRLRWQFLWWQNKNKIQNTIKFIFMQQLLATTFAYKVTHPNSNNRMNNGIRERIEMRSLSMCIYVQYIPTLDLFDSM